MERQVLLGRLLREPLRKVPWWHARTRANLEEWEEAEKKEKEQEEGDS